MTSRKQLLLPVVAVILLAGVLGATGVPTLGGTDESPDTPTPQLESAQSPTSADSGADVTVRSQRRSPGISVTFDNQTTNGTAVTIDSVTLPEGGVVVVLIDVGNGPGKFFGRSTALPPGRSTNVAIDLDIPVNGTQTLWAIAESDDEEMLDSAVVNSSREPPFICDYVNPERNIDTPGLLLGIEDWRGNGITTQQLLRVVAGWRSDDPVPVCY